MTLQVPRRFYSLDLIRGLAALSVIFWHWQHFFFAGSTFVPYDMEAQPFYSTFFFLYHTGWLAVDFFFALSGFIFFWLYAEQIATGSVGAWKFFALRFSRLYPLHLITLLLVALLQYRVFSTQGDYFVVPFNDAYHFVLNLFMASSWGLEQGQSFNGPVWSVSVEVLMYGLFFALCAVFRLRLTAIIAMVVLGLVMFAIQPIIGRGIFSFFLGGLVFRFYRHLVNGGLVKNVLRVVLPVTVLLWLATIAEVRFAWFWPTVESLLAIVLPAKLHGLIPALSHSAMRFFPIALLFPLTILTLALAETQRGHLGRRLAMVGNVTYSSYLLHFPLQIVAFSLATELGLGQAFFYTPLALLLFFVVLIVLCVLSYRYVELPCQAFLRVRMLSRSEKTKAQLDPQNT